MSQPVEKKVIILPNRPGIHEAGPDRYVVDASDLGLAPGQWPNLFTVEGSGQLWSFEAVERAGTAAYSAEEGELLGVTYRSGTKTLNVFND